MPTNPIKNEMSNELIVSARPCPKGCSESAGYWESLNPKMTMPLVATSINVWKASANNAILWEITPKNSFIPNRNKLLKIERYPSNLPTFSRFDGSRGLPSLGITLFTKNVVNLFIYRYAGIPVISSPKTRVCISCVPS